MLPDRTGPAPRAGLGPKILALGVLVLALWAQSRALVGVFYDDGIYVVAAKALAQGAGYRNIHLPDALPMVHFPPLYPWVLSWCWRLWPQFPANVVAFELVDAAALASAAWILGRHAGRLQVPAPLRYALLAAGFLAFPLLATLGVRFSEPLFLLLVAGAVALADRATGESNSAPWALAAGLLAGLAVLCRSVGLAAAGGIALALWLARQRRAALLAAGAASLVALPWAVWVWAKAPQVDPLLANYTTYWDEARQAGWQPILQGLALRGFRPLPELLLPRLPLWAFYPLGLMVVAAVICGGIAAARRAPALIGFLSLYLLMISLWPFAPHRFVWIVLPWLMLLLGMGWLRAWRAGRLGKAAAALLAGAVAAGYLPRETLSLAERRFEAPAERSSQAFRLLVGSIAAETPPGAVVASEDEALIYLYTGRRTVPSHLFRWEGLGTRPLPPEQIADYLCRSGATHLAVTGPGDPAADLVAWLGSAARATAQPMFEVAGGPALYRLQCVR